MSGVWARWIRGWLLGMGWLPTVAAGGEWPGSLFTTAEERRQPARTPPLREEAPAAVDGVIQLPDGRWRVWSGGVWWGDDGDSGDIEQVGHGVVERCIDGRRQRVRVGAPQPAEGEAEAVEVVGQCSDGRE